MQTKKDIAIELLAQGVKQSEIAKELNVTEPTISTWKKEPDFIDKYKAALWKRLQDAVPDAISSLIDLATNAKNPNIRYAASRDILDRLGFKPDENVKVSMDPVIIVNDLKE